MNKNILKISTLVAIWAFCSQNATAQQGFGTNQPSKASVIEMKSGTKGLLIPRVALTDLNNFGPIVGNAGITPAETNSLMVYNTTTDISANLTEGYYYWTATHANNGTIGYWQRLMTGTDEAALALDGDVTGSLNNTTVGKIQGRDVANTAPTSNQVLTWNGSAWTPTSLTPAQITDAQNVTAGSNKVTLGGTPTGASLQPFSIDVVEANLTLSNMGGKVTNDQITPGSTGQVLVTDGTTTSWQNPVDNNTTYTGSTSVHLDGTSFQREALTGDVTADRNSNVTTIANNAVTTDKIADANVTAAKLTAGTGAANRVAIADATGAVTYTDALPSSSVDGEDVTAGSNKVTLGGTPQGAALKAFSVDVVEANLTLSNMGGKVTNDQITTGNAGQVLVTSTDGTTTSWIDQSVIAPTTTNALSSAANSMTSNVNGVSSSANIINSNELSLNTDNHLVSTINGIPSSALDLSAAVQAAETLTSITQDATSGVITYERERGTNQTANVVNSTTDNLISYDAGAFLNATTVQGAQKTTVVESGDLKYATVSPNTPQGSNETTYTVTVKAAPRFFYMPAVMFNTDNQTTGTTTLTRDLYQLYANQFNGTAHHIVQGANTAGTAAVETVNYTGGVVSSANATNPLSSYLFTRGELEYHITYYDQTVFEIVGITEGGVLEYKIIGEATPMSYMNIVFVIK